MRPRPTSGTGTACRRRGPRCLLGEQRSLHTGSQSTRTPSTSTRHDACPNHETCTPDVAGSRDALTTGMGRAGRRLSALSRNRRRTSRWLVGIEEVPRWLLWNEPAR